MPDNTNKTLTEKVKGALKRWFVKEQVYDFALNTREIAGPLQFTAGGLFMWFVLGPQQWDFLPQGRRLQLWDQQAYRYSALANLTDAGETPIRMRITTRPYPAYEYAWSLDEQTVEPLHHVPGHETWQDFLTAGQKRLQSTGLDQKLVMFGVRIGDLPSKHVRHELLFGSDVPDLATVDLIERMAKVERIMAGDGLNAKTASSRDMAFLSTVRCRWVCRHRSPPGWAGTGGRSTTWPSSWRPASGTTRRWTRWCGWSRSSTATRSTGGWPWSAAASCPTSSGPRTAATRGCWPPAGCRSRSRCHCPVCCSPPGRWRRRSPSSRTVPRASLSITPSTR